MALSGSAAGERLMMSVRVKNRIVVLCGPELHHLSTCATLIRAGLNVVGICVADQRTAAIPFRHLTGSIRRKGIWHTISRSLARLAYLAINSREYQLVYNRLFNQNAIEKTLRPYADRVYHTNNYARPRTLEWLRAKQPDVLVVHSSYWVAKKIRDLSAKGIVLGGLTQSNGRSHSAFWRTPQDAGCTVFLLDEEMQPADLVAREKIPVAPGDSFRTLEWKGAIRTAELQAAALKTLDDAGDLPRLRVASSPEADLKKPTLEFVR